ncbi:PriCT-2 domain-containing protein [Mammaliicoccus sciuri]
MLCLNINMFIRWSKQCKYSTEECDNMWNPCPTEC